MKQTREQVYRAIDGEREYQKKWIKPDYPDDHEVETWLLYMQEYMNRAVHEASLSTDKYATLQMVRKITALGVACMEQHGAPLR